MSAMVHATRSLMEFGDPSSEGGEEMGEEMSHEE